MATRNMAGAKGEGMDKGRKASTKSPEAFTFRGPRRSSEAEETGACAVE